MAKVVFYPHSRARHGARPRPSARLIQAMFGLGRIRPQWLRVDADVMDGGGGKGGLRWKDTGG